MADPPKCQLCATSKPPIKTTMIELGWINGVQVHFCPLCDRARST